MPRPRGLPKTGGRQKGAVDKIKREAILAAQGITPLDYLMMLVRAETPPGLDPAVARARETLRFEAAKAAAPYVHARLQTTTLAGDPEKPQHKVVIEFVKAGGQVEVSPDWGLSRSGIVRNEQEGKTMRLDAAKAAAPYVHARLQTTRLAGDPEKPLKIDNLSDIEKARRLAFWWRRGPITLLEELLREEGMAR